jgi:hypothetical protein
MSSSSFQFFAPLTFFQKASAEPGKQRRIAGVISTEKLDKQGEVVIQKGLDFSPFLEEGWFNDNHSKKTADILGYPDKNGVKSFQKGDRLPDGTVAGSQLTWAEGYLLDTPDADRIWNLGQALQKAGGARRLGYSIEGNVQRRTGPANKVVAKALVRNVAITNCPVGDGTRLEVLAKSLNDVEKGLSMGTSTAPPATTGPQTGAGAGRVIAKQSLEQDGQARLNLKGEDEDEEGMSKAAAVARIETELGCSTAFAERAYETLADMKTNGIL